MAANRLAAVFVKFLTPCMFKFHGIIVYHIETQL